LGGSQIRTLESPAKQAAVRARKAGELTRSFGVHQDGVTLLTPFLVFFMLARKEQTYFRVVALLEGSLDACTLVNNLNGVLRGVAYS
jgi:hypothetical protein